MTPNLGFGLYIHWPFCQSKCPYCDFNSHVETAIDQKRWQQAYLAEIARCGAETTGRILDSVYFGGGTPSLMDPDLVSLILERVRQTWRQSNDIEITLEANPTSVEAGRFAGFRNAGINRVSIGVQALQDQHLRQLGRLHTVNDAIGAIEIATATFPRVNFDLIYARQHQSLTDWRSELQLALSLGTSHMSLYQLTIEEGTVFHARQMRGLLLGLPKDDQAADMFDLTQELCNAAGIPSYEVSNHASMGQESRHNLIYWRGGDYVGIGPGAHGRLLHDGHRVATEGIKTPQAWLDGVERRANGELPRTLMLSKDAGAEYLMMGLRVKEGIRPSHYRHLTGLDLPKGKIQDLIGLRLLMEGQDSLHATQSGILVLDAILRDVLA
ncbi:MAG: radical SAM family heme chaperone HemW [Alphaproteobacteria bacterium]